MTPNDQNNYLRRERIIIDESDGIDPIYEAFYIESIIYAAGRATEAFRRFDTALSNADEPAPIVAAAHEALTHTAAVSRFFWPARTKELASSRANKLRQSFELTEESPLNNRELRNALEHFDERLDEFLLQGHVGYFFPGPLVDSASLADDQLGSIFRLVDHQEEVFVLLGKKHPFGSMRRAVEEILKHATRMMENGGRL